jgi:predicted Zn-dependent protease
MEVDKASSAARIAVHKNDWRTVRRYAQEILLRNNRDAEGYFLSGLVEHAAKRPDRAITAFDRALQLDPSRYDAAIELASQYARNRDFRKAFLLLKKYASHLDDNPRYLNMAGSAYTIIKKWHNAWPLFRKASELQPNNDLFRSNVAYCATTLGKIDVARKTYQSLLRRHPHHMRNHYSLSKLQTAIDDAHITEMKLVLRETKLQPHRNVYLYYALGKELEDLEQWVESFEFYKMGGDAITSVSTYRLQDDIDVIDMIIDVCDSDWLNSPGGLRGSQADKTPVFVLGLPRTGTTLTDRILSSHSQIESTGENQFMEMAIRSESGIHSNDIINTEMIAAYRDRDIAPVARKYLEAGDYLLGNKRFFIDKMPQNFMYLGFIAKAFPDARIVHLNRNPMDACFAMYKQVFSWAFRCSYTLQDLGHYYVAYSRIMRHWRNVLGDRIIEVAYEELVSSHEDQTRILLDRIGVDFEDACLTFHQNETATASASSTQVREKIHTRSVGRWKRFAKQLMPLQKYLESQGIDVGS